MGKCIVNDKKSSEYYSYVRTEMIRYVPDNIKKVLEIGCGKGIFGKELKRSRNIEIWGVEFCKAAGEDAKQNLDKVIVGDIEKGDIDLPENYFDCVIFNDVLEHLFYPWSVLKNISKYLQNNGHVVSSIPNIRYLDIVKKLICKKDWKYEDEGVLDITHVRFFTEKSIKRMFEESGYYVTLIEGINVTDFYWKFKVFNWFMGDKFGDMKFKQFACVAQKRDSVNVLS